MSKTELSSMNKESLKKEVSQLKKEFFNLRLNISTMHVKDYSQFKKLRRRLAQTLTLLNQKNMVEK